MCLARRWNTIFCTVDECSSQMESPIGYDMMDVDADKLLRRIDKHTASMLAIALGRTVENYVRRC